MKLYIKKRKAKISAAILLIITFTVLFIADSVWNKASPVIADIAKSEAITTVNLLLSTKTAFEDNGKILKIKYSDDGKVSSIMTDTAQLNKAKADLCKNICTDLKDANLKVKVNLGDLTDTFLTAGKGIVLNIRLTSYSACVTDIATKIYSSGINQTLYRITAKTEVTFTILLPRLEKQTVTVSADIPLCETLIVGEVPNYIH